MALPGASAVRPADAVNVAATCVGTSALGPGRRSVVWVQGCPFRCRGCISPEWIPERVADVVAAQELAAHLLSDPAVTGLTFSGGEPMAQAAALAAVARRARAARDVSLVCFTGYSLERLRERPPSPGVPDLLAEVDVLVDGLYLEGRNDGRGLRGSDNQRIHHLSPRLVSSGYDFEGRVRTAEIRVGGDDRAADLLLVGVPPPGLLERWHEVADRIRHGRTSLEQAQRG